MTASGTRRGGEEGSTSAVPPEGEEVVPLLEEQIEVGKRQTTGRVRIATRTDERQELVRAALERDEVEIERVPVGREVDEVPAVREDGDTLVVPVVEEVLHVETRLVLREEIRLTRRRSVETVEQPVTVRSQTVTVDRDPGPGE
ncbi:MAG TPA: DUF2382 domain-containing protein [Geminicoccaceae bacterium]|nr:DUF2382 domain-containing protein [Geminicoccaceae bacterium]